MNLDDDDDSVFEQALRADLPSRAEQNRLRQRILAAGIAAGAALGSTNVAAAAQASFGASALSKVSALSWPAKLCVAAALAAPVAALPLVYAPVPGPAIVSQVRSTAATVRARSAAQAPRSHAALPSAAPQPTAQQSELDLEPKPEPEPKLAAERTQPNVAARPAMAQTSNGPTPVAPSPTPSGLIDGNASAALPAVAAFDAPAQVAPASEPERLRNDSTLAAETQLLDRAFAALAASDRRTASALVAEHARRFPNGLLRQERERARTRLEQDPKGE
jgi:hypothetical protein